MKKVIRNISLFLLIFLLAVPVMAGDMISVGKKNDGLCLQLQSNLTIGDENEYEVVIYTQVEIDGEKYSAYVCDIPYSGTELAEFREKKLIEDKDLVLTGKVGVQIFQVENKDSWMNITGLVEYTSNTYKNKDYSIAVSEKGVERVENLSASDCYILMKNDWSLLPVDIAEKLYSFQVTTDEDGNVTGVVDKKGELKNTLNLYSLEEKKDGKVFQKVEVAGVKIVDEEAASETGTAKSTATPKPTATAKPTATPEPTATAKPTATPEPTATPKPTATAKPTATPEPTATPKPTATPEPTATAKPTATPEPTATPKSTATAKPTVTPSDSSKASDGTANSGEKVQAPSGSGITMVTSTPDPKKEPTKKPEPTVTKAPKATKTQAPKPTVTNTPTPVPTEEQETESTEAPKESVVTQAAQPTNTPAPEGKTEKESRHLIPVFGKMSASKLIVLLILLVLIFVMLCFINRLKADKTPERKPSERPRRMPQNDEDTIDPTIRPDSGRTSYKIQSAVVNNKGRVRKNNEDNFYLNGTIMPRERMDEGACISATCSENVQLYAVCDGMGGTDNGEDASYGAVRALAARKQEHGNLNDTRAFTGVLRSISDEICQNATRKGRKSGTTIVAMLVKDGTLTLTNVGDSRIYRMRNQSLKQMSLDHSKVQRMISMGLLTPEQARKDPSRHVITQYLGMPPEIRVSPYYAPDAQIMENDVYLLCSDGLSDMVEDAQIEAILRQKSDPQEAANELVKAALERGGRDNVTVMIVKVTAGTNRRSSGNSGSSGKKTIVKVLQAITGVGVLASLSDLIYYLIK